MEEQLVVALDAMGGDNAPDEIIKGAVSAVEKSGKMKVLLVGKEAVIKGTLAKYPHKEEQIEIVGAEEVITTEESPVLAIRRKKDSSIVVGQRLVRDGKADAFISAGSTGAVLAGGMMVVGRIKGVERTPLGTLVPTENGVALIVDSGANVDARASHLVQFAKMGSVYMENALGIPKPRVALVNIGVEEEKGNALVKETHPLLKECEDLNYIGYVEAREIPHGAADVIVCDGFAGNLMLKLYEGVGGVLISKIKGSLMSSLKTKIGALLIKPTLKATLKTFDASEYGGAPLLGLKGLVVKTHGSSKSKEICNSILQCQTFKEQNINEKIKNSLMEKGDQDRKGESNDGI